jgi:hypothetical protein
VRRYQPPHRRANVQDQEGGHYSIMTREAGEHAPQLLVVRPEK